MKSEKVPILLIVFNRLRTVQALIDAVRLYQPTELFVAADGPRKDKPGEKEKCDEVRQWIIEHVNWDCNLHTLFREENVGCGYGPSGAISWFFEHVEQGIILEDDCIPHPDFYEYAAELLERYKDNENVYAINGSHDLTKKYGDGSYYFSMQNRPFHGWATWRRAWRIFDFDLNGLTPLKLDCALLRYGANNRERKYWKWEYSRVKNGHYKNSTWDYQFSMCIWRHHGCTIMPNVNLITNIGFGSDATHPFVETDQDAKRQVSPIMPIQYPTSEKISRQSDLDYFVSHLQIFMDLTPWYKLLKRRIKRILGIPLSK